MRAFIALIALLAVLLSAATTTAQTQPSSSLAVSVSPAAGTAGTTFRLQLTDASASSQVPVIVFDPTGAQNVLKVITDANGAANVPLVPPASGWDLGVYRVVVAGAGGQSVSATFAVGDGTAHVRVAPDLPSPTSALEVTGVGLPANTTVQLVLTLAGGLGQRQVSATTDGNGTLDTFLWPQPLGFDFFSAGRYELAISGTTLSTAFFIREHPSTSFIDVPSSVAPGGEATLQFSAYAPNHYLWILYAGADGRTAGEFLVGPSDDRGAVGATVQFPALAPGTYLLGTPYDWGETTFRVPDPTPTPSPTETLTPTATSTPTPRPTATPHAMPTHKATSKTKAHAACHKTKAGKRKCKA